MWVTFKVITNFLKIELFNTLYGLLKTCSKLGKRHTQPVYRLLPLKIVLTGWTSPIISFHVVTQIGRNMVRTLESNICLFEAIVNHFEFTWPIWNIVDRATTFPHFWSKRVPIASSTTAHEEAKVGFKPRGHFRRPEFSLY